MTSASDVFAAIGSALRFARRGSLDENHRRIAELRARFAEVARENPHAWIREAPDAEATGTPSPANPMISLLYLNANPRVDMAAGLIVCSLAATRAAGIDEERLVHLRAGVEIRETEMLSHRLELHRAPALGLAGRRREELTGRELPRRPAPVEHAGGARVEGYTLAHRGGAPVRAIAACRSARGRQEAP